MIKELLSVFTNKKSVLSMLALIALHIAIALPFKSWELVPAFTDIRPVSGMLPVYGIFMGPIGGFAAAISNFIEDALSGMLTLGSIAGFFANLLVPYFYYKSIERFFKKPFSIQSGKDILMYSLISAALSLFHAALITLFVYMIGTNIQPWPFFSGIWITNFFFAMVLGLPLIIFLKAEYGFLDFGSKKDHYLVR